MESCVPGSLISTFHHEIIFAKLNLKVEYPPFYERVFWDSSSPGKVSINWAINTIDSKKLFPNKPVESQVSEVNNILLNIYSNYIPNKIVLCEDKDPPWLANWIRAVIKMKNDASSVNLATNETVTKINFDEQSISNLIAALRPNKAHGYDGLSIRMLKWVLIL